MLNQLRKRVATTLQNLNINNTFFNLKKEKKKKKKKKEKKKKKKVITANSIMCTVMLMSRSTHVYRHNITCAGEDLI